MSLNFGRDTTTVIGQYADVRATKIVGCERLDKCTLWMHVKIESVRLRALRFGPFREHSITKNGCARGLLSTLYVANARHLSILYTGLSVVIF